MADAWGGSWGAAWGVSWGTDGATPPPVIEETDTHDGIRRKRPRVTYEDERREARLRARHELRETVHAAFRKTYGEAAKRELKADLERIAQTLLPEINAGGVSASLSQVMDLIEQYQAELVAARQAEQNDEALTLLLMAM